MKNIYFFNQKITLFWNLTKHLSNRWILAVLMLAFFSISGYSQKKGEGKGSKDIIVRACTQYIGNGLYRVNFGYDNPNKKEITVDENNSFVVSGKGKRKSKGLNSFKKGAEDKAFTMEFSEKESVEWTVVNPSGKIHTVIANANSSHCPKEQEGVIFPVVGQYNGKYYDLIGLNLGSLTAGNAGDIPSELIFQISDDKQKVMIVIVPKEGELQQVMDMLRNKYSIPLSDFLIDPVTIISEDLSAIDVFFPIIELESLNLENQIINFVRSLFPTDQNSKIIGTVMSQGDSVQRSNIVRDSYRMVKNGQLIPVDGTGIDIGAISNSFDTQPFTGKSKGTIDVVQGDLPGEGNSDYPIPVEVFKEYPFGIASDEGRAMLQIIHDIAPGSKLGFYSGVLSPRDIELAVNRFGFADYDIVFDDLTFITEPFFGGGRVAQAIKLFTNELGKFYFSSAGNVGNQGSQAIFKSSPSVPVTNFLSSTVERAHVFGINADGTEDILQKFNVTKKGTYLIVLQWDEGMASQENSIGAITDLDIYIVDDFGNLIVGNNRNNDDGDATEILVFQSTGVGNANIMITSANGAPDPNLAFRYIVFRSDGLEISEYYGAPTISGHAMIPEVRAIAAVNYEKSDNPVPEYYSSYGGVLPNGFNAEVTLTAPDGVHTNVASIGQKKTGDKFPTFYGTSASVAHAAASMALLMSPQSSWYPDGFPVEVSTLTNSLADQAIQLFSQNAAPAGDPNRAGAGFLNVENVFKQIATQTPKLKVLNWEDAITPGTEPFEVTIIGDYFPNEPTVLLDGVELEIVSKSGTEIVAKVPLFTGNPGVQVSAGSITPNTDTQAISEPLTFLEDGKIAINIIAIDLSIEFGHAANITYIVEGLPEGETLESQGLPELIFSSAAVFPYPDANNYKITPYFEVELTEAQLNAFQINYISGILTVSRKDLLIKPKDDTYIYGEAIDVVLNYVYDDSGVDNNEDFLSLIQNAHQSDFYSAKKSYLLFNEFKPLINDWKALINDWKALINDYNILEFLEGSSWISTEKTIQNEFKALINEVGIINLDPVHFTDYIDSKDNGTTNDFKPLINEFKALINMADLNDGNVYLENEFKPLINDWKALINDYSSVFTIVHTDDGPSDSEPDVSISKFYSSNLLTGLHVFTESHYVYPGVLLNDIEANFNITYSSGRLTILPAAIRVNIIPDNLVINQGDIPEISSTLEGFVYEDNLETVFPDGVERYLVDQNGREFEEGDVGVFDVRIRMPQNYYFIYENEAKVFINPYDDSTRKVRIYLDCVEYNPGAADGLFYTAIFTYENDNFYPVYVIDDLDNNLTGPAEYEGELPTVFMPGRGSTEIRFDGKQLTWNLTTYGSTHKSSVSSYSTSASGKCDGKMDTSYEVYPNPVTSANSYTLTIQQNISEVSSVNILNMYGRTMKTMNFDGNFQTMEVDMEIYPTGMYIVRITNETESISFNIIKE